MSNMKCYVLIAITCLSILVNTSVVEAISDQGHVELSFVNVENNGTSGSSNYWVRLKCINKTQYTFTKTLITATDFTSKTILYNCQTIGFHNDIEAIGVSTINEFKPGNVIYQVFCVGPTPGDTLEVAMTFMCDLTKDKQTEKIQFQLPDLKKIVSIKDNKKDIINQVFNNIDISFTDRDPVVITSGELININFNINKMNDEDFILAKKISIPIIYTIQRLDSNGNMNFFPEKYLINSTPSGNIYKLISKDKRSNSFKINTDYNKTKQFHGLFTMPTDLFQAGKYRLSIQLGHRTQSNKIIEKTVYKNFEITPYPYKNNLDPDKIHKMSVYICQRVSQAFLNNDFIFLEKLAGQFNNNKERSPGGLWVIDMFYSSFYDIFNLDVKNEPYWSEMKTKTLLWMKQYPDSPVAALVYAKFFQQYAWKYRGSGYANTVPENAWGPFYENLKTAKLFLENNKTKLKNEQYYDTLMANIMIEIGSPIREFNDHINEGLNKNPLNYNLYFAAVRKYLPKWGGNKEMIEQFANDSAKRTKSSDGMGLYTRIYWVALQSQYQDKLFTDTDVKWENMRQGMYDIFKNYKSRNNLNYFAYFSCLAKAKDDARYFMKMIDSPDLDAWKTEENYLYYKKWAEN